jgi:hypothetical protein
MMYPLTNITAPIVLAAFTLAAAPVAAPTVPNENLHYSVNWPTGVSLGEAQLSASSSSASMHFSFDLDAGAPGYSVSDRYRSGASAGFCSAEFSKSTSHGSKKVTEQETFDAGTGTVTRGSGSGQSELDGAACGKDALTFLYFLRHELSQGRMPTDATVYFGAPYQVRLSAAGTENIKVGGTPTDADRIDAEIAGPSSNVSVELLFLKDPARTLAMVRVPLSLGKFFMELVK